MFLPPSRQSPRPEMPFLRAGIVRKAPDGRDHWLGGLAVDHWAGWTGPRTNLPFKGKTSPDMRLVFLHAWEVVVDTSILRPMADSCCPDPGVGRYNDAGHPDNEPRWCDVLKRHQTSKMCHSGPKQGQWTCRETAFRLTFCPNFP